MIRKSRLTNNRAMKRVVGSKSKNKKLELLSKIEDKLDNIGVSYGPIVYDELQSRLEQTIDIFNNDLDNLLSDFFSTYASKNKKSKIKEDKDSSKKPKYISEYENSKKD
tara:strand:+ start:259 stop:585 length:327 start_codon:yes stop_codon:yes gene_type:complete